VRLTRTPLSQERSRLLSQIVFAPISNLTALHEKGPVFQFSDFREHFLGEVILDCFDLRSSDFRESYGFGTSFRGALLDQSDFSYANMTGVDFTTAATQEENPPCPATIGPFHPDRTTSLTNVNFSYARLNHAKFDGAQLENSNFSNTVLFRASFIGADITTVNFDGAIVGSGDEAPELSSIANEFFGETDDSMKSLLMSKWKLVAEKPDHPFLNKTDLDDTIYHALRMR